MKLARIANKKTPDIAVRRLKVPQAKSYLSITFHTYGVQVTPTAENAAVTSALA